jgi:hypothetical protein
MTTPRQQRVAISSRTPEPAFFRHGALYTVVRSAEHWAAVFPDHDIRSVHDYDVRTVDWEHEALLIAALGMRPHSGYSVEMDVQAVGGGLVVSVEEHTPKEGYDYAMSLVWPYAAVIVDSEPASVTFRLLPVDLSYAA